MGDSEFLGTQDGERQVDEAGERDDGDDGVVHGGPDGGASVEAPAEEDEADRKREERHREQRE
jgi:hypothetical protein